MRLSMGFGGSAESWLQQQALYDLAQTRKKTGNLNIKRFVPAGEQIGYSPPFRSKLAFSVGRLVSRRCHDISTLRRLVPVPRRTGLGVLESRRAA